ncbi:MAG: Smr/MutS family protein [Aquaticitalea sp.]
MKTFEIGDTVLVLDEEISGRVTNISNDSIFIETTDGFEMEFAPSELLKINPKLSLKSELFSNQSASSVISEKEQPTRRNAPRIKPKERNQPTMEVDLHIHQLTSSDKHMSSHEKLNFQLDTAQRQLEFAIRNRIQKVVFIHGVGEGVLKIELGYLFRKYDNVKYYDADYQKYGLGATEVYVFQNAKNAN